MVDSFWWSRGPTVPRRGGGVGFIRWLLLAFLSQLAHRMLAPCTSGCFTVWTLGEPDPSLPGRVLFTWVPKWLESQVIVGLISSDLDIRVARLLRGRHAATLLKIGLRSWEAELNKLLEEEEPSIMAVDVLIWASGTQWGCGVERFLPVRKLNGIHTNRKFCRKNRLNPGSLTPKTPKYILNHYCRLTTEPGTPQGHNSLSKDK